MPTVIDGIEYYTIAETAKGLEVTPQKIEAYIKQGLKSQKIGGQVLITVNNLDEFMQVFGDEVKKEKKEIERSLRIATINIDYLNQVNQDELIREGLMVYIQSLKEPMRSDLVNNSLKGNNILEGYNKEEFLLGWKRFFEEYFKKRREEFFRERLTEEDYNYWIAQNAPGLYS